ncbi:hypothetical protein Ping_3423 [Psychromonas ingrahamii 37]|uniref:KAP NTPase domain-containing protein n=1 Tax=Psychromonas ingrahamii (strain DSM 17664 / CCUG 51855 / 37) TaxID=357804 RepID=A1T042_PSYIN|nr:P-loop NTPase fold protein [Psychromonas ingrahamii]ABM05107.1 hypothetical protein Ping_3423 [Psychromonas ingrahamii 37]
MTDIIKRIENLFKDDSMPPMILIDGDWGSGKTYFIKNKLIPHFENKDKKVVFFSLYGISDLNDFRDKLLSVYSMNDKDASTGFKDLSTIFTKLGSVLGESNASNLGAIANSLTGMIKHAALGRIKGFTLILDDLERVADDKLTGLLLGECIELAENNQIKIIVAANAKKITTNTMLEKAFVDIIPYKTSPEEMVNIAIEGIELFEKNKINIKNEVIRLDYTNLRVLKRALFRLKPVLQKIKESNEIIKEPSAKIATSTILAICFAHYEKHYTKKEISKNVVRSEIIKIHLDNKGKKTDPPSMKEKELSIILGNVNTVLNTLDYCFGEKLKINIINDLNLPKKKDPLNSMITGNYIYGTEEEFVLGIALLKKCIMSKETVNFEQWGKACHMLLYFSRFNYINDTEEDLWVTINEFKNIIDFAPNDGYTSWISSIDNQELKNILREKSASASNKSQNIATKAFKDVMVHSWKNALETEIHSSQSNKVLSFTDSEFLNQCIENWDAIDIKEFNIALGERYEVLTSNSYDQELINLKGIKKMLEEKLQKMESSFKKGELTKLLHTSGKTLKHLIDIQAKNSRD